MKIKIVQNTKSIILALILTLCVGYVSASSTFTNPPAGTIPPANNTDAPINVGTVTQIKYGSLMLNGSLWLKATGLTNGLIVENGKVGIGTTTPTVKLEVIGDAHVSKAFVDNLTPISANELASKSYVDGKVVAATISLRQDSCYWTGFSTQAANGTIGAMICNLGYYVAGTQYQYGIGVRIYCCRP